MQDPLVRQAVLDLLRASDAFRHAYADFERSRAPETIRALARAEADIDLAREKVVHAQFRQD